MASRLNIPNDRQHVGSELGCLRLTGHAHALDGRRQGRASPAACRAPWPPLEPHSLYGFPSIPKRRECRSYGWSLETQLLLRDRYNRCVI